MFIRLIQEYGLEPEVADHLSNAYGDKAFAVAKLAELTGKRWPVVGRKLHSEFHYIDAEVRYAIHEYACTAADVIARRMRIAFLNVDASVEIITHLIEIMAAELNWTKSEQEAQTKAALEFLHLEMGSDLNKQSKNQVPVELTKEEVNKYTKQFEAIDKDKNGYISLNDLKRTVKVLS